MGGGKSGISSDPRERKFEQTFRTEEDKIVHDTIEHGLVYDQYGGLLEHAIGDEYHVEPSTYYLNMQDIRLTHNHPDWNINDVIFPGGVFSPDDLYQFQYYRGTKELRAVDSERRYSLKRMASIDGANGKGMASAYSKYAESLEKEATTVSDKAVADGKIPDDEGHYNKHCMQYIFSHCRKWLRNHAKEYGYQYSEHKR